MFICFTFGVFSDNAASLQKKLKNFSGLVWARLQLINNQPWSYLFKWEHEQSFEHLVVLCCVSRTLKMMVPLTHTALLYRGALDAINVLNLWHPSYQIVLLDFYPPRLFERVHFCHISNFILYIWHSQTQCLFSIVRKGHISHSDKVGLLCRQRA